MKWLNAVVLESYLTKFSDDEIVSREIPVVTLFLWPPETPLSISFPTKVSEHMSRPSTFKT